MPTRSQAHLTRMGRMTSGGVSPARPSTISALSPNTAVIGGADLTMTVTGTGFLPGCKIIFNGGPEPTTYISPTSVSTQVHPSTAGTPGTYPVFVENIDGQDSNSLGFTFTAT